MTTRQSLEDLLSEIDNYANDQVSRADFALTFIETIEVLDDIPFSIIDEARDWQYKIETQGDTLQASSGSQNKALKAWLRRLIETYA